MKKSILLLNLTVAFFGLSAVAKPAMPGLRIVKQPDGTTIKIRVTGDEKFHLTFSEDGSLLHKDANGFYCIATLSHDGEIVSTGISPDASGVSEIALKHSDINFEELRSVRKIGDKAPQSGIGMSHTDYPTVGAPKALVILAEFPDMRFAEFYNPRAYFEGMLNGENFTDYDATGSVLQYFKDQSKGLFTPDFDVFGPVMLSESYTYYGGNDRYGLDKHVPEMIVETVELLDDDVDFSVYDTDKDGRIDNVYVFYAGLGEADYGDEDTVWPQASDVTRYGIHKKVDGVTIGAFACSNELFGDIPDGMGAFTHEFSHVMGLPDLYHTENPNVDYTPLYYDIMDVGSYNNNSRTPPNYSAYERNALGWQQPIILDGPYSVVLNEISSGEFGMIPTDNVNEFFLFENRQLIGWDKYLPYHGMLIWHIDYDRDAFRYNTVNNSRNHQRVDLVEANGKPSINNMLYYTFPGRTKSTSFTADTDPALKDWKGKAIDLPVTDIVEKDGKIYFDVAGGGDDPTSIGEISAEGTLPEYITLQGVKIEKPLPGSIVLELRGNKKKKIIVR